MTKNIIKRYPKIVLIFICLQMAVISAFLAVIYFNEKTIANFRESSESKYSDIFISDMRDMSNIVSSNTGSDIFSKYLMLYQKARSASDALTETGYSEAVKRTITKALNDISKNIMDYDLSSADLSTGTEFGLNSRNLEFITLFGSMDIYSAYNNYVSAEDDNIPSKEFVIETKPRFDSAGISESKREANKLFGYGSALNECFNLTSSGEYLFSCKNAYAVINSVGQFPLEAEVFTYQSDNLQSGEGKYVYSIAECKTIADNFISEFYPKNIYRYMELNTETDFGDKIEFIFGGKDDKKIKIDISKSTGKMLSLSTQNLLKS